VASGEEVRNGPSKQGAAAGKWWWMRRWESSGEAAERWRMRCNGGKRWGSGGGGCGSDELEHSKLREEVCYAVQTKNSYAVSFSLNLTFVLAGP
jgi:hypothetical protein